MQKLSKVSEKIYKKGNIQVFNMSDLADLIGVSRKTIKKNIDDLGIEPAATDERNNNLYLLSDYLKITSKAKGGAESSDRFGGYADALEHKYAIAAKRDELKLNADLGRYVLADEVETEVARLFNFVRGSCDTLIDMVENTLHPDGHEMEIIDQKFKKHLSHSHQKILNDDY